MIHSPDEQRDQLAEETAGYEETLQPGSTVKVDFEAEHPGLARTVRMLNAVFKPASGSSGLEQIPPLSQIGRFQVERCLGSGNFGSVWLGHDPLLKRDVAIKVAHVGVHARADLQERFTREAHLAARLHHPNIVPVFETDVNDDRLFIVSEYCEGQSLAEWLADRAEPVEPVVAAELVRQLADATDHAHRHGLIHRDIKPANVLLEIDDASAIVPRLTDFGLARDLTSETSSTRTGMLVGTTEYMSPEQASGNVKAQAATSDIFSLGVLLYRLLCGTNPFSGKTDFEIIQQIIGTEPVAPSRRRPRVPRDLSSICLKCLEKRPDRRYASAAELRDDVDRFLRREPTAARPITAVERVARWSKRSPVAAALVFVSIASLAAMVIGMGVHLRQVELHAEELAEALADTRKEREVARQATKQAESERAVADREREVAETQRQVARETSYRSDMRLAFDFWERGQIHQAEEIVERQTPGDNLDLRGPEWFALAADFRAKYSEIGRHEGGVTECVLNGDESRAYSTGVDGKVRIWDVQSRELLNEFGPNIGEIHALALSPDQSTLAVGGKTWLLDLARVVLLDASTGERRRTWQTHKTTIESIAFSPDGKWLAAGSRYEPVQLTRLSDGSSFSLPANRRNRSVTFSPDSTFLVVITSGSHDIWRLDGETPEKTGHIPPRGYDPYLAHFAKSSLFLAVSYNRPNLIEVFEPTRPTVFAHALDKSHSRQAAYTCVGLSPDAQYLAAGDDAGKILLWKPNLTRLFKNIEDWGNARLLEATAIWRPHVSEVTSLAVTTTSTLISGGKDGRVAATAPFATGASHIRWQGIAVNASVLDGEELLLACEDGTIRRHLIDLTQAQPEATTTVAGPDTLAVVSSGPSPIRCLALSPDRELIACGTKRGGVWIYGRQSGELYRRLIDDQPKTTAKDDDIIDVLFSSNGRSLISASQEGFVTIHDIATGEKILTQTFPANVWDATLLPGDRFLAFGGRFEGIKILDLETRKLTQTIAGDDSYSLSVSPDGRWLASIHANGTVQLIDTLLTEQARVIPGHPSFGESIVFSSNSQTVISMDISGAIQFTDVQTGAVFGQLKLPQHVAGQDQNRYRYMRVHCSEQLLVAHGHGTEPVSDLYFWRIGEAVDTP